MSAAESTLTDLVLLVPCPRCKARAGEWCTTYQGHESETLHGPRRSPVEAAHGNGYTEGYHDGIAWERQAVGRFFAAHVKAAGQ